MTTSNHPRRMLPPGNTRKRKHTEADKPATPEAAEPIPSNQLLAGYLAHEFLTKGTLFGKKYEPDSARAGGEPSVGSTAAEPKGSQLKSQAAASAAEPTGVCVRKEHDSYCEVANILKTDGTHIKGIVNPTQLSRWIRM